jgi:hypothetical protein
MFCFSSYISAMKCISSLKSACPLNTHPEIDMTMTNLQGAQAELAELCRDDVIYERKCWNNCLEWRMDCGMGTVT